MPENFIGLSCSACHRVNFMRAASKRKKGIERTKLEMKKYCRFCRKHTVHKEKKWPK